MKFDLEFTRKVAPAVAGLGACLVLACAPIAAFAHPVPSLSRTIHAVAVSGPGSEESRGGSSTTANPSSKTDGNGRNNSCSTSESAAKASLGGNTDCVSEDLH